MLVGTYSDYYCSNGNQRLKPIVDNIIRKQFSWLPQSEYDECYSIAGQTVWYCETRYDKKRNNSFEKYLINSLNRKLKTRITHLNRKKRKGSLDNISLDAYIDEEENMTVSDMVADKQDEDVSSLTQRYLDSITKLQRKIAEMIMAGYDSETIKKELGLSDNKFKMIIQRMRSKDKIEPLEKLKGVR